MQSNEPLRLTTRNSSLLVKPSNSYAKDTERRGRVRGSPSAYLMTISPARSRTRIREGRSEMLFERTKLFVAPESSWARSGRRAPATWRLSTIRRLSLLEVVAWSCA
jgi:hypothetical protein